ncbi:MAG: hypothetical protein ACJ8G7_16805, partial [Rhizobacter sp.]
KLGVALHPLQDSWAYQGIPDVPKPLPGVLDCDAGLAWASPASRGGWNSHRADATWAWPAETLAMAAATYDVLMRYPAIGGATRSPKPWTAVAPMLAGFTKAKTKAEKRAWFETNGIADVSFLEGLSLPDGQQPFELRWPGRKLPTLTSVVSTQHRIAPDLLDFFSRFFDRWIATSDFDSLAAEYGGTGTGTGTKAEAKDNNKANDNNDAADNKPKAKNADKAKRPAAHSTQSADARELAARLKVWLIRDHGSVADLAHAAAPLTARQLTALDAQVRKPNAYAHYDASRLGYFPLLPKEEEASPLVAFLITPLPAAPGTAPRAVATVKFRHAPYDAVEVLAEKAAEHWRVVSIASTVEH